MELSKKIVMKKPDIKFLKKGLRVNGKYYPCWYSSSKHNLGKCATVYLKTYKPLPPEAQNEFAVENDTEIISDYFEKDRIRISPNARSVNIFSQRGI